MEKDVRLLNHGASPTHYDTADNNGGDVCGCSSNYSADKKYQKMGAVDPFQVEAVGDLAGEGEEGKVGK